MLPLILSEEFIPYAPHLAVTIWFQVLSPPYRGTFQHSLTVLYSIGLETYLELEVDASHIQTRYPTDPTQEKIIHKTSKREYIYGTITLYGSKIPNKIRFIPRGLKVCLYTTSP